jgi:hypothetical protein
MLPSGFSLDWGLADEHHREFAYIAFGARLRSSRPGRAVGHVLVPAVVALLALLLLIAGYWPGAD